MQHFITLANFQFPAEYAVLKLLLDQEHIRCFFKNETFIGVFPFTTSTGGGIHLKVHPEDFDSAKEILEKWQYPSHLKKV